LIQEIIDPIVDLVHQLNYRKALPWIDLALGSYFLWVTNEEDQSLSHLNQALKIAEEIKSRAALWLAVYCLWSHHTENCEFEKVDKEYERLLGWSKAANDISSISYLKAYFSAMVYAPQGRIDLALETSREALKIAMTCNDRVKCVAYFGSGVAKFTKGSFDEAEENLLKSVEFCEKSGSFFYGAFATAYLSWIYFELENYQKALHFLNEGVLLLERSGAFSEFSFIIKSLLAATRLLNGHKDIDLNELLEFYERTNTKQIKIAIAYNIGIILINIDDQHVIETEDWFLQMILACETSTRSRRMGGDIREEVG